ncbi:hypothetical protein BN1221_03446c [Brenneria goodwinii]|uniref:Uncharacterized protein n=1 Tax=Brenneria goodwinii TaxID=1109412 RepID=A0A0G4JYI3_9GAMM|nr:hypothetical protein BN1221_03446c [Brenneria goodwinii]
MRNTFCIRSAFFTAIISLIRCRSDERLVITAAPESGKTLEDVEISFSH